MDPQACYERILDALIEGDLEEATFAIDDLRNWAGRGGYLPVVTREKLYKLRERVVAAWRMKQDEYNLPAV